MGSYVPSLVVFSTATVQDVVVSLIFCLRRDGQDVALGPLDGLDLGLLDGAADVHDPDDARPASNVLDVGQSSPDKPIVLAPDTYDPRRSCRREVLDYTYRLASRHKRKRKWTDSTGEIPSDPSPPIAELVRERFPQQRRQF